MQSFLAVVTFDIIETLENFGYDVVPFDFIETPPFSESFEELGYENSNTISLLGTVNMLLFFMFVILIIAVIIKVIKSCHSMRFGRYIRARFTFQSQLSNFSQLLITGSLELLVCSIVSITPSLIELPILTEMDWSEL